MKYRIYQLCGRHGNNGGSPKKRNKRLIENRYEDTFESIKIHSVCVHTITGGIITSLVINAIKQFIDCSETLTSQIPLSKAPFDYF